MRIKSLKISKASTSDVQLIINLRTIISDEYSAIEHYTKILEVTEDEAVRSTIQSIINEEKVHVGEVLKHLFRLCPEERELYKKGATEE